ncbi:PREDICTED: beta-defensin 122-like [Chinchilla lanigera]|uniref:beta-defensin 122-like n=1 Tax=Chinchilla lanigera TaxID=34839 RepID=UPI00038E9D1D|nr:PREDICTED: beta-defensin 122-like [Chinchilla lanigera]
MRTFLLALVMLLFLFQAIPGNAERCWNERGSCREKCGKKELFFVFCVSGKACCVKPKYKPNIPQK